MNYISLLIPKFLSKIDNHLMLHTPHVWRTRVHFVAFYALLAWMLLFFIGFLYPLSMFDISRTPYKIDELKGVSFLFLLICGFFSMVYWWQQIVKFRILAARWYHSLMECCLFFIGIFMLWQAVNAFKNGIDTNIAYRVGRNLTTADKEKLYANNFYMPGYLNYNPAVMFSDYNFHDNDLIPYGYFEKSEKLLEICHQRIHRQGVILDSQFLHKTLIDKFDRNNLRSYYYGDNVYNEWKDSINEKAAKYIKPSKPVLDEVWDFNREKYVKKWTVLPFRTRDYRVLDSVYQLFNAYDKYQVDSVRSVKVNLVIEQLRKHQDYTLLPVLPSFMYADILNILDTCSNIYFNNQNKTYCDVLEEANKVFESDFRKNQIFSVFSPKDLKMYKNYLSDIIVLIPIGNRPSLTNMEVGLYYKRDSLATAFLSNLSPRSKGIYEELMAFYINNGVNKEEVAEQAGNIRWNKKTGKYIEIEKYISQGFLDTAFFYCDSIIAIKRKQKINFAQTFEVINSDLIWNIYNDIEHWKANKDTFLIKYESFKMKGKDEWDYIMTRKMRRDSIPIDTVFRWEIEDMLRFGNRYDSKNEYESYFYTEYKSYRNTQITDQDSAFLDGIFTRCGYLRDSSEHSRLFFHANAFYLYMADISINKSRGFLQGWNPFYLSTNNKLAIIILSFLLFFTSLAQSNLFTAAFIAFFINFVNNVFFNLGQNFQELDKNKQTFWIFGLLGILAIITAFNVLFRRFKLSIIYLLINVQLLALLGIFIWLFDSKTIEQQSNYAYLSIAFWGLMVWQYRSYLALPSKK